MYEPGTVLKLKKQREDIKVPEKTDPDTGRTRKAHTLPFPYNLVRVVGESPVDHGGRPDAQWSGVGARGVIITPLSGFGSTLDEPFGKLQALYDVEEVPTKVVEIAPIRVINSTTADAGPTPEEVFAVEAPGTPPEEGQIRGRTSPLGDVEDDSVKSPLDR